MTSLRLMLDFGARDATLTPRVATLYSITNRVGRFDVRSLAYGKQ
ncbi:MAG: hypothetical protein WC809_09780 [Sinimarinibacterium sp.]|jgi:hypothetical protein